MHVCSHVKVMLFKTWRRTTACVITYNYSLSDSIHIGCCSQSDILLWCANQLMMSIRPLGLKWTKLCIADWKGKSLSGTVHAWYEDDQVFAHVGCGNSGQWKHLRSLFMDWTWSSMVLDWWSDKERNLKM